MNRDETKDYKKIGLANYNDFILDLYDANPIANLGEGYSKKLKLSESSSGDKKVGSFDLLKESLRLRNTAVLNVKLKEKIFKWEKERFSQLKPYIPPKDKDKGTKTVINIDDEEDPPKFKLPKFKPKPKPKPKPSGQTGTQPNFGFNFDWSLVLPALGSLLGELLKQGIRPAEAGVLSKRESETSIGGGGTFGFAKNAKTKVLSKKILINSENIKRKSFQRSSSGIASKNLKQVGGGSTSIRSSGTATLTRPKVTSGGAGGTGTNLFKGGTGNVPYNPLYWPKDLIEMNKPPVNNIRKFKQFGSSVTQRPPASNNIVPFDGRNSGSIFSRLSRIKKRISNIKSSPIITKSNPIPIFKSLNNTLSNTLKYVKNNPAGIIKGGTNFAKGAVIGFIADLVMQFGFNKLNNLQLKNYVDYYNKADKETQKKIIEKLRTQQKNENDWLKKNMIGRIINTMLKIANLGGKTISEQKLDTYNTRMRLLGISPSSEDPPTRQPTRQPTTTTPTGSGTTPTGDRSINFSREQGSDRSGDPGIDFHFGDYKSNYSLYDGVVVETGKLYGTNYGNVVTIRSIDPTTGKSFDAMYAHFANGTIEVTPGQTVKSGDYLGPVGFNGVRGPGDKAALQGNGAGNMSGFHTSVDFFEPNKFPGHVTMPYSNRQHIINSILDKKILPGLNSTNEQKPQEKPPVTSKGPDADFLKNLNFNKDPNSLKPQSNLSSPLNNNVEIGRLNEDEDESEISQLFANAVALGSQLNPGGTGQIQYVPVPIEIPSETSIASGPTPHWGYSLQTG